MNVYTRIPKQLDDTAFGLFASEGGVIHLAKSQSDFQVLKIEYNNLGNSILSEEKASKCASDMSTMSQNQPPKRLKIPTKFLEEEKGIDKKTYMKDRGNCEGAKQNRTLVGSEIKSSFKKDRKYEDHRGEHYARSSGRSFEDNNNSEVATDRNRPASKLIKDNQDLQKLFDSVRGKESQEQQPKQVGKLKLPPSFHLHRSHDEMGRDNFYRKVNDALPYDSKINDAVAMTFNDWKNDENINKENYGSSNLSSAKEDFNGQVDASFKQNSPVLDKHNIIWGNDESEEKILHTQKRNDAQNYWLSKQKQTVGENEEAGYVENMKSKNKMFVNGMNLTTSTSGELNSHSIKRTCNGTLNQSHSDKYNRKMNSFDMGERGDNEVLKDSSTANEEDAKDPKMHHENNEERGFKTVGKLKLPTAFTCNQDKQLQNSNEKKRHATNVRGEPNKNDKWEANISAEMQTKTGEDQKNAKSTTIFKEDRSSVTKSWRSNNARVGNLGRQEKILPERVSKNEEKEKEAKTIDDAKSIGKLDIKKVFSQQIEEYPSEKKEEVSAFSKTKAIFDQTGNKKNSRKQTGVGKLRLGSSRSERYEEIENLNPEGQLPSNMSNQMKEQLEKILQGRSESVSSQLSSSSSSSKRNDNKEVGRLSLSSISSLEISFTSPRTNEDFSARTYDDDPFSNTSDCEDGEKANANRVNRGSLELQLGNIFQKKHANGDSASSSAISSLNTSLNAGGNKDIINYTSASKEESESISKKRMLVDAIKEKHSTEMGAKEDAENDNHTKEMNTSFLNEHAKTQNQTKFPNYADINSSQYENEEERSKIRGRVFIPNVFENQREKENTTIANNNVKNVKSVSQNTAKGLITMAQKGKGSKERDTKALVGMEASDNISARKIDDTSISTRTSNEAKRVNASASILGGKNLAGEKIVDSANIDKETKLSEDFSVKQPMNHTAKKVNFHNGTGIIREDGSKESVPTKQPTAGKLSLSLIKSFEGGNTIRNRPGTPGRNHSSQPKGIFDEARKEKSQMLPIAEEKKLIEGRIDVRENGISKFNETEDISSKVHSTQSHSIENDTPENDRSSKTESKQAVRGEEPSKRTVGKLSIPAMFK